MGKKSKEETAKRVADEIARKGSKKTDIKKDSKPDKKAEKKEESKPDKKSDKKKVEPKADKKSAKKEEPKADKKAAKKEEPKADKKEDSKVDAEDTWVPDESNMTAFQLKDRKQKTCFVGNLPLYTTAKQLRQLFGKHGKVDKVWFRSVATIMDSKLPQKAKIIKKEYSE